MSRELSLSIVRAALLSFCVLLCGCAVEETKPDSIVPKITDLVDLGSAMPEAGIEPSFGDSDGRFMPGEWVVIKGRNLSGAQISIDGLQVPVAASYAQGLIIRVPQKLGMRKPHELSAVTPHGRVAASFKTSHYIIGTDTDGNRHHFMRAHMDAERLIEEPRFEVEQVRPFFNLIAAQGALMYGIGLYGELPEGDYKVEIKPVSLVAPEKPVELASEFVQMKSKPTAASLSSNNLMLILGYSDIALVDISDPYKPTQLSRYTLPARKEKVPAYIDAEFVNDGKNIAVLDTHANRVTLLDISNPADIRLCNHIDVFPDALLPATADIFVDPFDSRRLWLLGGRNLRNLYRKTVDYSKSIFSGTEAAESYDKYSMLIPLNVSGNSIATGEAFKLPGGSVPFFGVFGQDRNIYVSKINMTFLKFDGDEDWLNYRDLFKNIRSTVLDNLNLGGVLKISIENKSVESEIEGYGIYYHIAHAPDLGAVLTMLRLKAGLTGPKGAWGIGIQSNGSYAVRATERNALYPPYSLGHISVQE